jgi:hypothetical protein
MHLTLDHIEKWENVISTVDKEHIPITCVKKMTLKLKGKRQKTINLESLRKTGLDLEEIEIVISRTMNELHREIVNIDFVIDVSTVAKQVQPETDRLLSIL